MALFMFLGFGPAGIVAGVLPHFLYEASIAFQVALTTCL